MVWEDVIKEFKYLKGVTERRAAQYTKMLGTHKKFVNIGPINSKLCTAYGNLTIDNPNSLFSLGIGQAQIF